MAFQNCLGICVSTVEIHWRLWRFADFLWKCDGHLAVICGILGLGGRYSCRFVHICGILMEILQVFVGIFLYLWEFDGNLACIYG